MLTITDIIDILDDVKYEDWRFFVGANAKVPWFKVEFDAPCNYTGESTVQCGRKWRLSYHMTKSEVVHTALKAVLTAVEHEAREGFTYKGRSIFGPHFDVDTLHDMCGRDDAEDTRSGEWVLTRGR